MVFLQVAMVIGAIAGAFVAGGAIDLGFPVEVAIVRGSVAFGAVAFVGYVGQLIVVTAPARERDVAHERRGGHHELDDLYDVPVPEAETADESPAPPSLPRLMAPAPRDEQLPGEAAADDLRSAA